jgi:hypothetical protein
MLISLPELPNLIFISTGSASPLQLHQITEKAIDTHAIT